MTLRSNLAISRWIWSQVCSGKVYRQSYVCISGNNCINIILWFQYYCSSSWLSSIRRRNWIDFLSDFSMAFSDHSFKWSEKIGRTWHTIDVHVLASNTGSDYNNCVGLHYAWQANTGSGAWWNGGQCTEGRTTKGKGRKYYTCARSTCPRYDREHRLAETPIEKNRKDVFISFADSGLGVLWAFRCCIWESRSKWSRAWLQSRLRHAPRKSYCICK